MRNLKNLNPRVRTVVRNITLCCMFGLLQYGFIPHSRAELIWSGGAGNVHWTNANNWLTPFSLAYTNSNTNLVFQGTFNTVNQLRANWTVNSMTFSNNLSTFETTPGAAGFFITINGGGITNQSLNDVTFSATLAFTLAADQAWLVEDGSNLRILGSVGGTGRLVKTGEGTLLLNNNGNSFSGGFVLSNGTVQINNNGAFGNAPATFYGSSSSRVQSVSTSGDITITNASLQTAGAGNTNLIFQVNGTGANERIIRLLGTSTSIDPGMNVVIYNEGSNPNSGLDLQVNGATTFANRFVISNNSALTISTPAGGDPSPNITILSGEISGEGRVLRGGRASGDAGTLVLLASNSYSGGTFFNGGTLGLGHHHALGTGALVFDDASQLAPSRARLFATNGSITITNEIQWNKRTDATSSGIGHRLRLEGSDGITFQGNFVAGITNRHGDAVAGIRIESAGTGHFVYEGNIIATNGIQFFDKQGANTFTMSGTSNQISGNMSVSQGQLILTNTSVKLGGDLLVTNGARLRANGVVDFSAGKGLVVSNGSSFKVDGTYSNRGDVTFFAGSAVSNINVAAGDLFHVTGNLSNFTSLTINEPGGSVLPGTFAGIEIDGSLSNFGSITWNFSVAPSGGLGTPDNPYYGGIRSTSDIFSPYLDSSGFFTGGFFAVGILPHQYLKTYFDGTFYYLAIIPEPSIYMLMIFGLGWIIMMTLLKRKRTSNVD